MYKQQLTFAYLNFGLTLESYLKEITDKKNDYTDDGRTSTCQMEQVQRQKLAQHFDHMDSEQTKVDF